MVMEAVERRVIERPRMRGRMHQIAFICSIPLGLTLVAVAATPLARAAGAVYAFSVSALFGVSASYHRIPWSPAGRRLMQRLDHATIFVLIAGTYTPLAVVALRGPARIGVLAGVWLVAASGITLKLFHLDRSHGIGFALYLGLGWSGVVMVPRLLSRIGAPETVLMVAGGLLYTIGAILFAQGRPNPKPTVFGYHEFWHTMVVAGAACHYATVLMLARIG